jgi:hypothetical protein
MVHDGHDWARKCWSTRGMSGHESAGPLNGMFYPSSAGTLTFARSIEMSVESDFTTIFERYAIAGHSFSFGENG